MKFDVKVEGQPARLELARESDSCRFRIEWDGAGGEQSGEAAVLRVEPGIYSVLVEGRSYEVKVIPGPQGWFVDVSGRHYAIEVSDPRSLRRPSPGFADQGRVTLTSPMPGRVVRVLAAQGDAVEPGQGIVIVEAMKMQNEVRAPRAGTLIQVGAVEGETVAAGAVLAVIE